MFSRHVSYCLDRRRENRIFLMSVSGDLVKVYFVCPIFNLSRMNSVFLYDVIYFNVLFRVVIMNIPQSLMVLLSLSKPPVLPVFSY